LRSRRARTGPKRNASLRFGVDDAETRAAAAARTGSIAMPEMENDHIVETPDEARSAVTGHNVRYVLAAGTIGVTLLFAAIFLYYFV
jgi:hypothetical protein